MARRRFRTVPLATRSRVTNGDLLPGVDGRSAWHKRYRDLNARHISDLGGEDNASEAEIALVRRTSALIVELELLEVRFATKGSAEKTLDLYSRLNNTMRRNLESLGMKRRQVDVTKELEGLLSKPSGDRSGDNDILDIEVVDETKT